MDANIQILVNLLRKGKTSSSPKTLARLSGLSIDAVRRALKRAVVEKSILKSFQGPFSFYRVPPSLVWSRVRKGRKVFAWHLDGQQWPKARCDRLVLLRRAGVSESTISRIVD